MSDESRVPTNMRMLLIVETLANAAQPLTPSEINKNIGLPKPSIYRLCQTLVQDGFLAREPDRKRLRPGRRLRQISAGLAAASHSHIVRHQILKSVSDEIGETVNFSEPTENGMRYIDRVETAWPLRIQLSVGSNVPFHCTASGKCYLASLPSSRCRSFLQAIDLSSETPQTVTDVETLVEEMGNARRLGYTTDNEEYLEGMVAISVPVYDPSGRFYASLSVHAPKQRMAIPDLLKHRTTLEEGVQKLSQELFN